MVTGDAFNQWYDQVIRDLEHKKKCVDDVAGWAESLRQLFVDTAEFLTITENHGIVQNLAKFVWGQPELEFMGFWLQSRVLGRPRRHFVRLRSFPDPRISRR